jgi:hypothetical protein
VTPHATAAPRGPRRLRGLVLVVTLGGACTQGGSSPAPAEAAHFELVCRASNTASAAELFCIRTDTRTGDVLRVQHMSLPTSDGSTAVAAPGMPGRYTTACDATSTDTQSDLYCIRLDTVSGEMLLITLPKVGSIPHADPDRL